MSNKNTATQKVGVKEIARRANVSIATVDRVIHNRNGVSEETRKKIQHIIKEFDYQPNLLASRLASKKVYELAVLIPDVSTDTLYWKAPLNGIARAESEIAKYGINISKYFYDLSDKSSFVDLSEDILSKKVDGILMAPSFNDEATDFSMKCKAREIPFVFINSDVPNLQSLCYIGPELFRSGYLAAHLLSYGVHDEAKILVVNISREIDHHHHLLRKEDGFRKYFEKHNRTNTIIKIDVLETEFVAIERSLHNVFNKHPDIKAIFTTNSRVGDVGHYMKANKKQNLLLIGYDYLQENIDLLKSEVIDFLICQKPEEQGYRGIMSLYQHLVLSADVEKNYYMPIDIITKENYSFYTN
ncbi:substrate-binding domain-containing protein [Catalinimonas alkaloidigena]|uniref:LacI family DNA-binding transcriptional regulator n=1 Tax=Catalinimonas alkaloidigena TaxID=1075417 RepID=UPI0024068080|nr:substrate-binding domain-containing protein [Catalinimonas alkaloidigena]